MATLLISAAVNIGVGLLINALFPPPDIEQFGPRLTDLGFTSAAYGKFVNIVFGTDRVDGNIIDSTDPPIEEVVNVESESAGKGGGQKQTTTTYTYFLTCRIAFCIEGADDIMRLWGDGKIIHDKTGSSTINKAGVSFTFYPGGPTQRQDSEEVARRNGDIPAYRHLTSVKLNRMPLADFGNRIPNFTAEIAFNSSLTTPFVTLDESTGLDVPGSLSGADTTYMSINPERNEVYSLKHTTKGMWSADVNTLDLRTVTEQSGIGASKPVVGLDGFIYRQTGATNGADLLKIDIDTGLEIGRFNSGNSLTDSLTNYGNNGQWYQLNSLVGGNIGAQSTLFHINTSFGAASGSVSNAGLVGVSNPIKHVMSDADGLVSGEVISGFGIPDHDRNRFFVFQSNAGADEYRLVQYIPAYLGGTVVELDAVDTSIVRNFTRGTFSAGDDFEGTGTPTGWAVNKTNGDLILSNGTSAIIYNPDDNVILAQSLDVGGLRGRNNYYSGDRIAFGIGDNSDGTIRIISTSTLEIINDINTDSIGWSGTDGIIHEESVVWDDKAGAIILSRVDTSSLAPVDNRVLKILVQRKSAEGVGLDSVVLAMSTSYQRQEMAGLVAADVDVTTLAADTVFGYTLNRKSTMRDALEPLRKRFEFDAIQSDWIMKFPKRGATPSITIPEEDVGILKRGQELTDDPAVQEIRQDDLALPMRLAIRYRNKEDDYQTDLEYDKRQIFPDRTMSSKTEVTFDIPLVDTASNMKQLAQKSLWTTWNERTSYKTVIPWTYLTLDASDVFNMGVFSETVQLRMLENDFGVGWAIDMVGVVEDTKQYSSTIAGTQGAGKVPQLVPSSLPTRLFALDAPLLSLQDFLVSPISNAYMAVGAFGDDWPGGTVMKSSDGQNFNITGSVNVEAATAKVAVVPSVWEFNSDGDFPNRIQEVADGGTLTISPLRRDTAWQSVPTDETDMYAGANHIAIIKASNGQVEILGFVDAVLNDDNTVDLTRLLRGRLGTEDVADLGISVGDSVVLLSSSLNVKESDSIRSQLLGLSELNTSLFFKGVTVGTALEGSTTISKTYTGRDLQPFSVVHLTAVDTAGDGVVDWERRARGPLAAEWLDGTGDVVLNELIEQYEVVISDGVDSITRTVNDATTTTFTAAELSAASVTLTGATVTVQMVSGTSSTIKSFIKSTTVV